jgi:hypothetical protein
MVEIPDELTAALERLTRSARLDLLRALINPEAGRLDRIRQLYEREDIRPVAGLLIVLDSDPWARTIVTEALLRTFPGPG